MRITQETLDEENLLEYLNTGEYDKAISVIDDYYSSTNPSGFDDPGGITKSDNLTHESDIDPTKTLEIYKSKKSHVSYFIVLSLIFLGFGIISYKANSWIPMLIPSMILPAVVGMVIDFFNNKWQVRLTPETIEFRKSKLPPIHWDNILAIYHYRRNPPFIARGVGTAHFIEIYKKDSLQHESFSIRGLKLSPKEIVGITNKYRRINEN
jgi:hypothetical protein